MLFIRLTINKIIFYSLLIWTCQGMAITVGTYDAPPFSMYADGENIGMATEAVRTLLKKCDIEKYDIINYPLARGLAELHEGRIDIYYPYMLDSNDKTNDYILIGPISRYNIALFVRRDYREEVSIPAMKDLIVGVERGGISDLILRKYDMHIEQATQPVSCLRMVLADRVSACVIGALPGQYAAAINNLSDKLRFADSGHYADMYVVLSSRLPKELIAKIKNTFDVLKSEDYFAIQQHDYESKFQLFIKTLS